MWFRILIALVVTLTLTAGATLAFALSERGEFAKRIDSNALEACKRDRVLTIGLRTAIMTARDRDKATGQKDSAAAFDRQLKRLRQILVLPCEPTPRPKVFGRNDFKNDNYAKPEKYRPDDPSVIGGPE